MTRCRAVIPVVASTLLAGCTYAAYVEFGPGDDRPNVSLAASPPIAARGDAIGLVAAATDDYRLVEVEFYRVDGGGSATLLGRDDSAPYALETVVPSSAGSEVRYRARAIDDAGQSGDSQTIAIAVR